MSAYSDQTKWFYAIIVSNPHLLMMMKVSKMKEVTVKINKTVSFEHSSLDKK